LICKWHLLLLSLDIEASCMSVGIGGIFPNAFSMLLLSSATYFAESSVDGQSKGLECYSSFRQCKFSGDRTLSSISKS
jgi:hypothetical protein